MRTATLAEPPADFEDRYELYVQNGDKFDIANLTASSGPTVRIYLFNDGSEADYARLARMFYPGSSSSPDADSDVARESSGGTTPIARMVIFGHAGGSEMWGGASHFAAADFNPEAPAPSYSLAHFGLFPRRCWFTRTAAVRSVGCDPQKWGTAFASRYLRAGGSVTTTTRSVRPSCSAPLFVNGVCRSFDGLEFAISPAMSADRLDGPFWTVEDFHSSKFWANIAGKL